jgi:hypothetical protein
VSAQSLLKTHPIELNVSIDLSYGPVLEEAVTFETGATLEQTLDPKYSAYNHHGRGFNSYSIGALSKFYTDLVLGRPFPLKFVTHELRDLDTLIAIALFLQRDLVLLPRTMQLVQAVDFVHCHGDRVSCHVDSVFESFRGFVKNGFFSQKDTVPLNTRLSSFFQILRRFLEGEDFVSLKRTEVKIVEKGTNGFVVALATNLLDGLSQLYGKGYLYGVLFGSPQSNGLRQVLLARKSEWVSFNLVQGSFILNELEVLSGGEVGWVVEGEYLWSPPCGSKIPMSDIVQIALRI